MSCTQCKANTVWTIRALRSQILITHGARIFCDLLCSWMTVILVKGPQQLFKRSTALYVNSSRTDDEEEEIME